MRSYFLLTEITCTLYKLARITSKINVHGPHIAQFARSTRSSAISVCLSVCMSLSLSFSGRFSNSALKIICKVMWGNFDIGVTLTQVAFC